MSFKELDIKDCYQTDSSNIPEDFYNQVFPQSVIYKRAAGFFSSSSFVTFGKSLKQFYLNGGKMQMLVSPQFSKEDYEAICSGIKAKEDVAIQRIIEAFDIDSILEYEGSNILAWLIYEDRLEIKIVVRRDNKPIGIFHDKFSIIADFENNMISFRGSMNEGVTAFVSNFETIEVDTSWDNSSKRTSQRLEQFETIWESQGQQWKTLDFPEAIKEDLINIRKPIPGVTKEYVQDVNEKTKPSIPETICLRKYQKKAIAAWLKNKQIGIFEMATGTGKTITSIAAFVKLLEVYEKNDGACGLVITVPYKVLLEQWVDNLSVFNIHPIACYESTASWKSKATDLIQLFNAGVRTNFCLITTNKTFSDKAFQEILKSVTGDYIFCADEMHHLTSDNALASLPYNALYRLGLSATLMSKYDDTNMNELISYFGCIVYQFTMKEAIEQGFLTRYRYYPVFVELTDAERDKYYEISKKISKAFLFNNDKTLKDNTPLKVLLAQRARLIASAENKLVKLKEFKNIIQGTSNNIFYCGDRIEAETNEKFIQQVTDILNDEIGIYTCKFTADENKIERANILKHFELGLIKGLAAIRCLDEGIDIPQLRRAFILSSGSNPKEFIQRRGRILRKAPGKKIAEIYDFIVIPTLNKKQIALLSDEEKKTECRIIERQFERLQEFASLAENGSEAYEAFINKWELYS
ncbi:DEAD/DEAH box helicase family protein [Acetobacterium sp.]|uniref:DEAD/DEAH box helicase family protein n=1 Tax=Acetobacterium sp. TaxID=1872094 RepID=UPI002F40712F